MIDLLGRQFNDPWSGKILFFLFLQATPSSPFRTLEGLLSQHSALSRNPSLVRCILYNMNTDKCAMLSLEVPRHHWKQLTNIDCVSLKRTHFFNNAFKQNRESRTETEHNRIESVKRPEQHPPPPRRNLSSNRSQSPSPRCVVERRK